MTDDVSSGGIYIDSDWKEEAAREKARLAELEAAEKAKKAAKTGGSAPGAAGSPMFLELVNLLAMQAMIGLGGYRDPGGAAVPPNPEAAKLHIDMLTALSDKTKGNLTDEESKTLEGVLHELRMQFVQHAGGGGGAGMAPQTGPADPMGGGAQ